MSLMALDILILNWLLVLPFFAALCVELFPRLSFHLPADREVEALGRGPFLLGALASLMGLGLAVSIFAITLGGGRVTADYWWTRDLYHLRFQADALSTMVVFAIQSVALVIHLHLAGQPVMPRAHHRAALLLTAQGGAVAAAVSADLIAIFFFLGTALIALWLKASLEARRGADRMLVSVFSGGLALLAGILLMWGNAGDSSTHPLPLLLLPLSPTAVRAIGLLVLLGLLPGLACLPGHGWVPALARSGVSSAMASALLLPLVVGHVMVRLLPGSLNLAAAPAVSKLALILGAAGLLWGGLRAWLARELRQLAAWLTVAQSGLLLVMLGASVGAGASDDFLRALTLHVLVAPVAVLAVWCVAGTVMARVGTDALGGLGGLLSRMPLAGIALVLAGLSLAGVPPLAGFPAQRLLVSGLLHEGRLAVVVVVLAGDILVGVASLGAFRRVFLRREAAPTLRAAPGWLWVALVLVVAPIVSCPVWSQQALHWSEVVSQRVLSIAP
jgi:formate hydrogenlyase subunit 3/multisubunit Na+/H+ antiporter MnhD subunit